MTPQGNNNYPKKYCKVMTSQYLLANNNSLAIITVKLEQSTSIGIRIGNTYDVAADS